MTNLKKLLRLGTIRFDNDMLYHSGNIVILYIEEGVYKVWNVKNGNWKVYKNEQEAVDVIYADIRNKD